MAMVEIERRRGARLREDANREIADFAEIIASFGPGTTQGKRYD